MEAPLQIQCHVLPAVPTAYGERLVSQNCQGSPRMVEGETSPSHTHTRTRVCAHARVCVVLVFQPQFSRVGFLPAYHPCFISTSSLACLMSTHFVSLKIKSLDGLNSCIEIGFHLTRKLSFSTKFISKATWR